MIYYIDDERSIKPGLLDRHGLTSVIDAPVCREYVGTGPGENRGLLVADSATRAKLRFVADAQTWAPRFGYPGTYVGFWNDSPPGPEQLKRDGDSVDGEPVPLEDGNEWVVGVLREWFDDDDRVSYLTKLRTVLARSPVTGTLVKGPVVRSHRDLWERSCKVADNLIDQMSGGRVEIEPRESDQLIADVLALNYRLGLDEIGALGLLNDALYPRIIFTALDLYQFKAIAGNVLRRRSDGTPTESDTKSGETPPTVAPATPTDPPSGK